MERYRIGVDVGGTHTDVALTDAQGRAYRIEKVPSTPHNPAIAVLAGLDRLLASGVAPARDRLLQPRHDGDHQRAA